MKTLNSFEALIQHITDLEKRLPALDLTNFTNVRIQHDAEDLVAAAYMPEDCRVKYPFPIKAMGDGNCFCRAASRLMFGEESRHAEVRVRIIIEGIKNYLTYTSPKWLEEGISNYKFKTNVPTYIASLGGHYDVHSTHQDTNLIYNNELFRFRLKGSEAGMFQVHMLAGVMGKNIMHIYPIYPGQESGRENFLQHRKVYHRVVRPPGGEMSQQFEAAIMFTPAGYGGSSEPNHFVPVVQ